MDDLKNVILQTLQELDTNENEQQLENSSDETENKKSIDDDFLIKLRERILVLFEGLQSPNINNLEKKVDLTINFLEYTLAEIDKQLSK